MNKEKCLHCGEGEPYYCEKCYQDLIAENARLQYHLTKIIPTKEKLVRLQDIVNHFQKIKHTQQTVEINEEDIKAIEELIARNQYLEYRDILKEIEEPINELINFAVCCSSSLNCDEYCTYFNHERDGCGILHEENFELKKSVKKLRKYFKVKEK